MSGLETGAFGAMGLLIAAVAALIFVLYFVPVPLWIAAWSSGAYVGLFTLVGMRLRRVPRRTRFSTYSERPVIGSGIRLRGSGSRPEP
jgi:hypothetical protein